MALVSPGLFTLGAPEHSFGLTKIDRIIILFFFFKLYIIVLVLPNIKMNPPQVYHNS